MKYYIKQKWFSWGDVFHIYDADGNELTRENQVARCGNAVTPPVPAALVRANLPECCTEE